MECTFLSSFCSSSVSIASLFSPASLPLAFSSFSLPSIAIYPLSHFFFFLFLRCPRPLSIHFISLPVFGAISPLPRLSLNLVSPGFLSPAGNEEEAGSVRRSTDDVWHAKRPRDGHESFAFQNRWTFFFFFFCGDIPVRHAGRWRSDIWSMPWTLEAAFHALTPYLSVSPAPRPHANTCSEFSAHVIVTLWHLMCVSCSNSVWPSTSARPSLSVWAPARLPPTAANDCLTFY